jgi:Tol biopolymer transport system component
LALTSGTRLGPYEVVALLGAGGMGEVYRARDAKLGRDVAIKILPSSFAADPDRLARFEREARLLASLNHPNIGAIYGIEDSAGMTALVLELIEGESLDARLRSSGSRGLRIADALGIARQVAEALDVAHERGIVHRDLKPANIMLTPDGTVKVLDFGLATDHGGSAGSSSRPDRSLTHLPTIITPTVDGVLLGTVPYMSPEQARGKALDKRTDIWAFGCVLYETVTGRRAFPGETMSDAIAAILEREPDWSSLPAALPLSVAQLIRRCLTKDPRRRLRDIGDALSMLAGEGSVGVASPPPRGGALGAAGWIVAAIVATAAVGGGGLWLRSRAAAGPSVSRLVRLTSGPALDQSPVIDRDGKWVAYLSNARGATDVWVKFVTGGDPVNLTGSTNLDVAPQVDSGGLSISPDGSQIAFAAGPHAGRDSSAIGTWVIPAPLGGIPRRLLEVGRGARWSPDGARLAFIVQGGTGGDAIWVAGADGANPHEVAPKRGGLHKHWAAWSHDSRYIYFNYSVTTTNVEPSSIYRVAATGGSIEPVLESVRRAVFPALTSDGAGLIYAANPASIDLGLWWKPIDAPPAAARQLTMGLGEYSEPSVSATGSRVVATMYDNRQSLIAFPAGVSSAADQATLITKGDTGDLDPTLSPDGSRLVFSSTRSGNRNLWSSRLDGRDARPLTSGESIDERPMFAPDGQRIAFVSDRGGERGIWLMNGEGGSPHILVKAQVLDTISWSPDGTRIVYAEPGDDAPRLSIVNVATGGVSPLHTRGPAAGPAWSPRADLIAYIESQARGNAPAVVRLQFVDSAGGPQAIPVFQPENNGNGVLAWQPDGRTLAAVGNPGSLPSVAWIVEPGNAGFVRKITDFPADTRIRGVTWSHDGTSLILGRQRRDSDIVLLDLRR